MAHHEVLLDIYVAQRTDPKILMVLWLFFRVIVKFSVKSFIY